MRGERKGTTLTGGFWARPRGKKHRLHYVLCIKSSLLYLDTDAHMMPSFQILSACRLHVCQECCYSTNVLAQCLYKSHQVSLLSVQPLANQISALQQANLLPYGRPFIKNSHKRGWPAQQLYSALVVPTQFKSMYQEGGSTHSHASKVLTVLHLRKRGPESLPAWIAYRCYCIIMLERRRKQKGHIPKR